LPIVIGTQLGSHEITALLGKGGMGEVYRARDTKLKREVAIKILPEEFSRDPDRVSRFQREAELLASLNHPNIAAIYDVEETGGSRYLVLELVEGDTLAERLRRGPIPAAEALQIAKHICEALEAAHEKGVIHRDLKPGNVKVTSDGKVKVLDFGLAKALEGSPATATMSNSPTLTLAGTNPGVILGTAAYMSPEQARGRAADQRSDVFSFGCVLYEMLTGRQAFQGEEVSDVLASILKSEADFNLLPAQLNPKIREVLRRCLEKNPKVRWHAVGDARVEIEAVLADPNGIAVQQQQKAAPTPFWRRAIPVAIAVVLTAAITGGSVWKLKPEPRLAITRFPVTLAEGQQFRATGRTLVAISQDGTQIVYEANRRLYHRLMSEVDARPIPGTDTLGTVANPVFSPDGRSVAFGSSDGTLKKIAVSGGAAVTICPADGPFGMSWGADGIVFGQGTKGIMRVSANGGKPELLVGVKGDEEAHGPQVLPAGEHVLFTLATGQGPDRWDNAKIMVQSTKTGERKTLIERGSDARYLPTGHIVYAFAGTLFAVPFDLRRLQVTGGPIPIVEGVRRATTTGTANFSFSDTGSLIYVPGPVSAGGDQQLLALQDRKGSVEPLKIPARSYGFPRSSPDGKRVAFESEAGKEVNIWIYDFAGTIAPRQLTVGGANRYAVWSADGERVAFQSDREGDLGIFWQRADGAGTAERLTKPEQGVMHIPDSWAPDGQSFSFSAIKGNESAVWIFSLKDKKATIFAQTPSALVRWSAFSPDGRWLAYQSNETKRNHIWVQPFPNTTGAKYPIIDGGHPFWSPDGKELFYNSGPAQTSVVGITTRPSFAFGAAAMIPAGLLNRNPSNSPRYSDITRDGKFIGVIAADQTQSGTPAAPQIQVVLNWFEDLKQRMTH
jgi:Tol biopolymer transport system component